MSWYYKVISCFALLNVSLFVSQERKRTLRQSPARSKRALSATATVSLSSDDEGGPSKELTQKRQQSTAKRSPGRPRRAASKEASVIVSPLPAGLFGREYELRPRDNKLLAVSSDEESAPPTTKTMKSVGSTRMSLNESNFRKRIADLAAGASTSKRATSTPQSKTTTTVQQNSPRIKTKLRFDPSNRRSGRSKQPLLTIEQVTENAEEENENSDKNVSIIAEAEDDTGGEKESDEEPLAGTSSVYPGWPPVGWKEFALAAFVTSLAAVGYLCYTTDYCKYW